MLGAMLVTEAALQLVAKSGLVASDFYLEKPKPSTGRFWLSRVSRPRTMRFQSPMR